MKTLRIVSRDPFLLHTVYSAFVKENTFILLPTISTGEKLLESELEKTDVILLDMEIPGQESWELLDILCRLPLCKRPAIFVMCRKLGEASLQYLGARATYCFVKPSSADHIVSVVEMLSRDSAARVCRVYPSQYAQIHDMVTRSLFDLGVAPHLQGYHLLREAVKLVLCAQTPWELSTMKDIYPAVATLCGCTVSMAEHAMRHAIDSAWMRASLTTLQNWFGYTTPAHRSTPSNSAFIYTVADRIRQELPASWM